MATSRAVPLIAALLVAANTAASAAPYGFIIAASDESSVRLYDADTAIRRGSNVSFWLNTISNPTSVAQGEAVSTMSQMTIDCAKFTYSVSSFTKYGADGKVLESGSVRGEASPMPPDTAGARVGKAVCSSGFPYKVAKSKVLLVANPKVAAEAHFKLQEQPR